MATTIQLNFWSSPKEIPQRLNSCPPRTPAAGILLGAVHRTTLDTSREWKCEPFALFHWVVSMHKRLVHAAAGIWTLFPSKAEYHSIMVHILFLIYPSVGKGVSSSFWLLWIKLLWMCLYKYPWKPLISFFWIDVQKRNYCIMWYWVCFFLYYLFWETGSPFSILAHHLTLLATGQQNFTSLARIVIFYFFKNVVVMTLWCIYSEVELFHQNWNCWNKGSRVIMWIF